MPRAFNQCVKPCEICGERLVLRNQRDVQRKRFCSRACTHRAIEETHKRKPKTLEWRTCRTCGQEFSCWPSQLQAFCSRPCFRSKPSRWNEKGYIKIPSRDGTGRHRVNEHVRIAERALGRALKPGEVVHHINMIKHDNRPQNLLICDTRYHGWLHRRYALRFAELHLRKEEGPCPGHLRVA